MNNKTHNYEIENRRHAIWFDAIGELIATSQDYLDAIDHISVHTTPSEPGERNTERERQYMIIDIEYMIPFIKLADIR